MSNPTKAELLGRNEALREQVDFLQGKLREERHHERRARRALHAGARRYAREQQHANDRIALVEESAVQSALTALEAVQDAHQSRKTAAAATRRADKLAAKLMIRARQAGKERRAWVGQVAGRERALVDAGKRVQGLKASLRQAKARTKAERAHSASVRRELEKQWEQVRELRRKLRESNKSMLMASLGGGLEVQPVSGRPFENTAGYSPAARRAAEGHQ